LKIENNTAFKVGVKFDEKMSKTLFWEEGQ
jgi:hypothetical protein